LCELIVAIDNELGVVYAAVSIVLLAARIGKELKMEQHLSTGALLREVARLHTHLQRENVACCGGTTVTQCTVLTELGRSGPIPLAALSRLIGFDKSWTSRAVEHLVQEGLIEKVPHASDHRMVRLSLSAAGEQRLAELNTTLNRFSEQVMEHIPVEAHTQVHSTLELLLSALQAEDEASFPQTAETGQRVSPFTPRALQGDSPCSCE
jgi:DNA-binding MarR family transcriptional regulator